MKPNLFAGTYTAIVTPFKDGKIDELVLKKLIQAQIKGGVDGIVPVGTTGESPTLDYEEHIEVIELAVAFAGGKIQVLAGTGGNSTSEAIYLTKGAEDAGADGSLQVAPYYNKPTQEGLFQHFKAIRRDQAPHRPLQRSEPLRHRDRRRYRQAPGCRLPERRRDQGGRRQCGSRQPASPDRGSRFHDPEWR
jgi:hypothetical protein